MPPASPHAPTIVCLGELLWDVYPDGARLGGASANVAHHLAQLGCHALLVSRVGDDERGRQATLALQRAGVDVRGVTVDPGRSTGEVHVRIEAGEPHFAIGAEAAWDHLRCPEELYPTVQRAHALCFGTLAQRTPLVRSALQDLLRRLRAASRRPLFIADLNLRPPFFDAALIEATLRQSDVVKLNTDELARLATLAPTAGAPLAWLIEELGVPLVALTSGDQGCRLMSRHVRVEAPAHRSSGRDPVGAGDAFCAVLARGLALGHPLPQIAEQANGYAAWVAGQAGAQPRLHPAERRRWALSEA